MVKWRQLLAATRAQLARKLHDFAAHEFMPAERHDDDLFLVEFPKSGVTWLTFLIANMNAIASDDRREITFFNVNDFVPDVQVVRHLGATLLPLPGYRCFKSHSSYLWAYRKVFYLVRDPRNVMVSYWTFLKSLGVWQGTLADFVDHPLYGIHPWVDHVNGWLQGVDAAASFALIRYEDLLRDAAGELKRLYALLGLPVSDEQLALAVERSSIERMRASESSFSSGHPALKSVEFVRRGQTGGAREALPDELCRHIERVAAPVMAQLGYVPREVSQQSLPAPK